MPYALPVHLLQAGLLVLVSLVTIAGLVILVLVFHAKLTAPRYGTTPSIKPGESACSGRPHYRVALD
jgi:hypothetical protein